MPKKTEITKDNNPSGWESVPEPESNLETDATNEELTDIEKELRELSAAPFSYDEDDPDIVSWKRVFLQYPSATREENLELVARYQNGDESALDLIVKKNSRLVFYVIRKLNIHGDAMLEDMFQEGSIGLIIAAKKFDVGRGFAFATYAYYWIRHKILRYIETAPYTIHLPLYHTQMLWKIKKATQILEASGNSEPTYAEIAEECGLTEEDVRTTLDECRKPTSLDAPVSGDVFFREDSDAASLYEFVADEKIQGGEDEAMQIGLSESIKEVLKCLNERELDVIKRRYGLDNHTPETLQEIGDSYGLSRERIRQIEHKAIRKLQHPFRAKKLRGYL